MEGKCVRTSRCKQFGPLLRFGIVKGLRKTFYDANSPLRLTYKSLGVNRGVKDKVATPTLFKEPAALDHLVWLSRPSSGVDQREGFRIL